MEEAERWSENGNANIKQYCQLCYKVVNVIKAGMQAKGTLKQDPEANT